MKTAKLENCTLGDLIEFQRGYDLPKDKFVQGKYPVQSSNGILGYHNEYKVKALGITIGRSGTVGIPHLLTENFYPHNTTLFVKDFKGNDVYYIYYLLKNLKLNDFKTGSGVPTMNRNHLHPLKIEAYKDLKIQQSIAKILSQLDQKIALNNQINAQLEQMAKTLYDYWFVQFDFPDENGKPYKSSGGAMIYNEQLKREIPKGWGVGCIGDYCKSTGGYAFKSKEWRSDGNPVIKITNILENQTLDTLQMDFVESREIDNKFKAIAGNIVIAMTGATIGKFAVVPKFESDIYINQRVGYFNLGKNPVERLPFFINSLNMSYIRESIFKLANGASQPNISNEQINNILLLNPQKDIIDNFNKVFKTFYYLILENEFSNRKLTQLRDFLLPMLMNGQVGVRDE